MGHYKLSVTVPNSITEVIKVSDYPDEYSFDNAYIETSYVLFSGQKRFVSGSSDGSMCFILKEDGIYIFNVSSAYSNCPCVAILKKY